VAFQKVNTLFIFLIILFTLYSCVTYTKSGNTNLNRDILIKVVSGNVYLNISGHISENIYPYNQNIYDDIKNGIINTIEMPIVVQGKETINQNMILYENDEFKHTLTMTEVVIVNVRTIDNEDAKILVFEYGRNTEYIIYGNNNLGQTISFKN
jgi:ABC-type enterochelin transport system permease subunit